MKPPSWEVCKEGDLCGPAQWNGLVICLLARQRGQAELRGSAGQVPPPTLPVAMTLSGVNGLRPGAQYRSQEPGALWQSFLSVCWGKLTLHVPFHSNGSRVIYDPSDCQLPP